MSPIAPALAILEAEVAALTARAGRRVQAGDLGVLDRAGHVALGPPGLISPNRACRLFRAADGWMALNLAREEDRELIPAWLGCDFGADPWDAVAAHARRQTCAALVESATLLGLPAGAVGEAANAEAEAPRRRMAPGVTSRRSGPPRVVDLSALWAGPMCGAILAAMGAVVTRIESARRPDPTRTTTPQFYRRLNDGKTHLSLDPTQPSDRTRLLDAVLAADVVITGARPRGLASLGLDPQQVFAANPGLVWVAVSGYGFTGPAAERVAFGDDAAAAGGLVRWTPGGAPRFLGDALADPVTGLAAAIGALRGLDEGGGVLIDVALARSAGTAATVCRLARAA